MSSRAAWLTAALTVRIMTAARETGLIRRFRRGSGRKKHKKKQKKHGKSPGSPVRASAPARGHRRTQALGP